MMSMIDGSNNYILNAMLEQQIDHIQIMEKEYRDDKTVDNYMVVTQEELKVWENMENIQRLVPRIETYAMAWNGIRTKGIAFLGIDPERENFMPLTLIFIPHAWISKKFIYFCL